MIVKIYNFIGYLVILLYMLACMYSAPARIGPWGGLLIGGAYFSFCRFMGGLYLADVLHLGTPSPPSRIFRPRRMLEMYLIQLELKGALFGVHGQVRSENS